MLVDLDSYLQKSFTKVSFSAEGWFSAKPSWKTNFNKGIWPSAAPHPPELEMDLNGFVCSTYLATPQAYVVTRQPLM